MRRRIARCDWSSRRLSRRADHRRRRAAPDRIHAIFRAILREQAGGRRRGRRSPAGADAAPAGLRRDRRRRGESAYRRHTARQPGRSTNSAAAWAWRCRSRAASSKRTAAASGRPPSPSGADTIRRSRRRDHHSSASELKPLKKPYVAIVDDDSAFANYLRTFLSLRGYETRSYSRGDEMLAAVKQGDPPDIVLLDVMMPGMNGLETLRALKAAKPELQVIMLSGREQASTIVEAVRLGAADYVVKPDDPEGLGEIALDAAIKSAIEKTRLVSRDHRAAAAAERRSGPRVPRSGATAPTMQTIATVIEQVVRQRRHRADSRRERRRQGARRARDPPALVAQGPAVRQGELRRAAGASCSRASCSATRRARSPARRRRASASSSRPTPARSSSTRSAR